MSENNVCKIVYEGGQGEIVEKKSRFIATVKPVETEEEAVAFINEMKKKYWDARHNCSAFVIGSRQELTRCSDDGEPAGTAGRPMLDVLLREEIHNTAVVVTRYFGGVLLGTGGLVRAYAKAAVGALEAAQTTETAEFVEFTVTFPYSKTGSVTYAAEKHAIPILDRKFADRVVFILRAEVPTAEQFRESFAEDISVSFAELRREIAPR